MVKELNPKNPVVFLYRQNGDGAFRNISIQSGTLTTVKNDMAASADATIHGGNVVTYLITPVLEKLVVGNWAIDRKEHGWNTTFAPLSAQKGALAESWEQPDPLTYVFKIR